MTPALVVALLACASPQQTELPAAQGAEPFGLSGAASEGEEGGSLVLGPPPLEEDARVERYLDEMLILDETRVAGEGPTVVREYAFFQGRDKRALRLDELLTIADEDALLARHQERGTARTMTFGGMAAAGGAMLLGGLGLFTIVLFDDAVAPALGMTPAELQGVTLWPTVGLLAGGIFVGTGAAFVPSMIWPLSEDVPEHELRRAVRQHNERLRAQLGIEARREQIPTGVPE